MHSARPSSRSAPGRTSVKSFESNVRTHARPVRQVLGGHGRPAGRVRASLCAGRPGTAERAALRPGERRADRAAPDRRGEGRRARGARSTRRTARGTIYVNLSRATTGDLRVRQAFMHAIDREALADALSFGSAKPTTQIFSLERHRSTTHRSTSCIRSTRSQGEGSAGGSRPQGRHRRHAAAAEHDGIQAARRGVAGDARRSRHPAEVRHGGRLAVHAVPPSAAARRHHAWRAGAGGPTRCNPSQSWPGPAARTTRWRRVAGDRRADRQGARHVLVQSRPPGRAAPAQSRDGGERFEFHR